MKKGLKIDKKKCTDFGKSTNSADLGDSVCSLAFRLNLHVLPSHEWDAWRSRIGSSQPIALRRVMRFARPLDTIIKRRW